MLFDLPLARSLLGWTLAFTGLFTVRKLLHHHGELLEVDLTIPVHVNLTNHVCPHAFFLCDVVAQNRRDFVSVNSAAAVPIKLIESSLEVSLVEDNVLVHSGSAPFSEINGATAILIG